MISGRLVEITNWQAPSLTSFPTVHFHRMQILHRPGMLREKDLVDPVHIQALRLPAAKHIRESGVAESQSSEDGYGPHVRSLSGRPPS